MSIGQQLLKDDDDFPLWRVEWDAAEHVANFKVFKVEAAYGEGDDFVISDEELRLSGYVKWDGCSNWDYHTENDMAHFCDVEGLHQFCSLQIWLYSKAADLMVELGATYPAENPEEFRLQPEEKPRT